MGTTLTRRGVLAVLTDGACVAINTGTYVSNDADFVLQGNVRQPALDDALRERGSSDGRSSGPHLGRGLTEAL